MTLLSVDREYLAGVLSQSLGDLSCDPALSIQLLRLLAEGQPVRVFTLAAAISCSEVEMMQRLACFSNVEWDAHHQIAAAVGLSQHPTVHHFTVAGRDLYTWCALDTLMFPAVLGMSAHVTSWCLVTGTQIALTVGPTQIDAVDPSTAVVSLVIPDRTGACCDIRSAFCNLTTFFATREAGRHWIAEQPPAREIALLTVADAWWVGHQVVQRLIQEGSQVACLPPNGNSGSAPISGN